METTMIINLAISAIVGIFILFGFFWGLIRGLRKTAFRGVWLICTALIALFLSQTIANLIINIDISSLGILNIGEQSYSTIKEFIKAYASEAIGNDILSQVPSLSVLIESLPLMFCSPIIFGILFWLLKIILWPIWAILAKIFIKKPEKKKIQEETNVVVVNQDNQNTFAINKLHLEQKNPKKPIKKHAFLGGLLGIAVGLIVCSVTFVPVFGVLDIVNELDKVEVYETTTQSNNENSLLSLVSQNNENELNKTTLLEQLLGKDKIYVDAVNNSVGTTILTITGMKALGNLEFNYLSSIKVGEKRISAKNEIKSALKVTNDISFISTLDLNHPTKEDINAVIEASYTILDYITESDLISLLGDEALDYITNGILNDEDFFIKLPETGSEHTDLLLEKLVELGTTYTLSDLVDDIKAYINIIKVLNDEDLIAPLFEEVNPPAGSETTVEDDNAYLNKILDMISNVSEGFTKKLTDAIFEIKIISALTPYLSNALMETLVLTINDPSLNFVPVTIADDLEIYKQQFSNIFTDLFTILFSVDASTDYILTNKTITTAGKLLDDLVDGYEDEQENIYYIISPQTYESFISYAVNDLKKQVDNPDAQIPENLKTSLKAIIDNIPAIKDYSTYEDEFNRFADAYDLTIPYIEEFKTVTEMADLENTNIKNIGTILNTLQDTIIFNGEVINLYNWFIENVLTDGKIGDTSLNDLVAVLKVANPQNANIDWENEFDRLQPLFTQIVTTTDFTEETLLGEEFLKTLGNNLQVIKNRNNNLTGTTTALLDIDGIIAEALKIAQELVENQDVKNALNNLSTTIKEYDNKSQINYKDEFVHIASLTTILNNADFSIETASTTIKNIVNGTSEANATKILDKVIFKTIIDKLPNANDYSSNTAIYNILTTAQTNIDSYKNETLTINNVKQEILNILDLVDLIDVVNSLDLNATDIDNTIETLSNSIQTIQNNTQIFTNIKVETVNYMFDMIKDEIDSASDLFSTLDIIENDINSNLNNITIKNIYNDMKLLEERFEINVDIDINNLDNNVISGINSNLKEILNRPSFTKTTTNAIYKVILDGINQKVQDLDASTEIEEVQTKLAEFKEEITNLISLEKLNIETKSLIDLNNNYYETGLTNIKNYIYANNPLNSTSN